MGFYVEHADKPNITWQRLWEILIGYVDHDLENADLGYAKEFLMELCSEDELKELGIWDWLCFESMDEEE